MIKSNTYINNQNIDLLTLEETQRICDKMMERIKLLIIEIKALKRIKIILLIFINIFLQDS